MWKEPNFDKVLIISIGFLLTYVPYNAICCMAPKVLEELGYGNLGFYSLALDYFCHTIGAIFFAHVFVHNLSPRACMILCQIGPLVWSIAYLFPAYLYKFPETDSWFVSDTFIYSFILVGNALLGVSTGIILVAAGHYIT